MPFGSGELCDGRSALKRESTTLRFYALQTGRVMRLFLSGAIAASATLFLCPSGSGELCDGSGNPCALTSGFAGRWEQHSRRSVFKSSIELPRYKTAVDLHASNTRNIAQQLDARTTHHRTLF